MATVCSSSRYVGAVVCLCGVCVFDDVYMHHVRNSCGEMGTHVASWGAICVLCYTHSLCSCVCGHCLICVRSSNLYFVYFFGPHVPYYVYVSRAWLQDETTNVWDELDDYMCALHLALYARACFISLFNFCTLHQLVFGLLFWFLCSIWCMVRGRLPVCCLLLLLSLVQGCTRTSDCRMV